MADSEKLTALKKAYAEIILNTAKEAAARIMVSERKAQRYQRELFAAKDESLRMLLRLKQMLDSKVNEAETTSLSQQRKIDELEAQLGEAEDIVKDLRTELRELQDELEKVMNSQMQPFGEQRLDRVPATQVTAVVEKDLSFGPVISSQPDTQCGLVTTLETKDSSLNGALDCNKCFCENGSHKDNCFVCNPDFASIMMRSNEPELCRNGCTQRIRAFERNLLGEDLPLSGKADGAKSQMFVRENGNEQTCHKLTAVVHDTHGLDKSMDEVKVMQEDGDCIKVRTVKSLRRKMKRATRYKKFKAQLHKSFSVQAVNNNVHCGEDSRITENIHDSAKSQMLFRENEDEQMCQKLTAVANDTCGAEKSAVEVKVMQVDGNWNKAHSVEFLRGKRKRAFRFKKCKAQLLNRFSDRAVDNIVHFVEDSKITEKIVQNDQEFPKIPRSPSNTDEAILQSGSVKITKCDKACTVQNTMYNDKSLIDELELTGCKAGSLESSQFLASTVDVGVASVLITNSEPKGSDATEVLPTQPINNKFLKYTFVRKRKKLSSSMPDADSDLENSTMKGDVEEKQNVSMDAQKSGLIPESSRDSLAQAAQQLVA